MLTLDRASLLPEEATVRALAARAKLCGSEASPPLAHTLHLRVTRRASRTACAK